MGGDHAPQSIVQGALDAAPFIKSGVVLVGIEEQIRALAPQLPAHFSIVHASEVVGMDEKPVDALRKKKDSSMAVCVNLVKEGRADCVVSAGNTGAATASSLMGWRQMAGIHRPAIATTMPNKHGLFLLLDAGASPDVDPEHLVEFAEMGLAYAELVMGRKDPKAHLLNIGEEPGKGNNFAKRVQELMGEHAWFAGNIEGKDLMREPIDVVVCDAFVGNIVLKTAEGVAEFIMSEIKSQIPTHPIKKLLYAPLRQVFAPLKQRLDYAEYGGSPLLGLNHLCFICHGRSNPKAIKSALIEADKAVQNRLMDGMRQRLSAHQ